jgi:hypothetical protein
MKFNPPSSYVEKAHAYAETLFKQFGLANHLPSPAIALTASESRVGITCHGIDPAGRFRVRP